MANFIELTEKGSGKKFIGNVDLLRRVFITTDGNTGVVGWNNNGFFEVEESYDEESYDDVIEKINNRMFKVLRKSK